MRRFTLFLAIVALATACDYDVHITTPTTPSTAPTPPPAPVATNVVEFRVSGDVVNVTVRENNGLDGLAQILTVLPYSHRVELGTRDNVFLSLEARAASPGFVHAAIFVNGIIFRESSSTGLAPVVTISGTYRR